MKTLYIFLMLASAPVICSILGGCANVQYAELPPVPEYTRMEKTYNLSAVIEVIPLNDNLVEKLLCKALSRNRYVNFSKDNYYKTTPGEQIRLLTVMHRLQTLHQRPEGWYLDTRIIVSVREPGYVWNKQLNYRSARYFQAYSRIYTKANKPIRKDYATGLKLAVENLFLIDEFRVAMEPGEVASEVVAETVETPESMWQKSLAFQNGENKNIYEALRWAYMAANAGSKSAQEYYIFHTMYSDINICGDNRLLFELMKKYAETGSGAAACRLGLMYENGHGISMNWQEAFLWYNIAYKRGNVAGMYHVGRCFEKGIGVLIDQKQALYYYRLAAKHGNIEAETRIKVLTD